MSTRRRPETPPPITEVRVFISHVSSAVKISRCVVGLFAFIGFESACAVDTVPGNADAHWLSDGDSRRRERRN